MDGRRLEVAAIRIIRQEKQRGAKHPMQSKKAHLNSIMGEFLDGSRNAIR